MENNLYHCHQVQAFINYIELMRARVESMMDEETIPGTMELE